MSSPHGAESAHRADHDPYAALRLRDVRFYLMGNFLAAFGLQLQTAAVFWQIYQRTGSKLQIALVGLVQVIPVIALTLPAGYFADRLNRKHLVIVSLAVIGCCSLGLMFVSLFHAPTEWMYVFLFGTGVARSMQQPAKSALFPQLVPREHFTNAVTWGTSTYQFAAIAGPAVCGGLLWWFAEPAVAYFLSSVAAFVFTFLLGSVHYRFTPAEQSDAPVKEIVAGAKFVWGAKVVLGATTLDMFAVLLGGAEALFSVYAKDILFAGPIGYGAMLAAQPVGALCMSFVQSHRRPFDRAGVALLCSVVGFGLTTIGFGLSASLPVSLLMLVLMGACDNVSVVLRHTLVQMLTPDAMRGRVSAINSMFISISNELGGFESGAVAHWWSPKFAVVTGGLGTIMVATLAAVSLPELRRYRRSTGLRQETAERREEAEAVV